MHNGVREKMLSPDIVLPSDRKFGIFFGCVFFVIGMFFFPTKGLVGPVAIALSGIFFFLSFFHSKTLKPLNLAWAKLGYLLGAIVNPVIMGLIFFVLITPIAFCCRCLGRDELSLKKEGSPTFWYTEQDDDSDPIDLQKMY